MIQENVKPAVGSILLSEPFMLDPHFKRTVILICEHDEQNGSVGFILNKTVNSVKVSDALVDFEMVQTPLFYGGPVAHDTLHYLHSYGEMINDSILISEGIYWGGDFEQITEYLKN
ncbi:MAG: YqgE/AlgH family protein, partial [Chitinophagales bacterium]